MTVLSAYELLAKAGKRDEKIDSFLLELTNKLHGVDVVDALKVKHNCPHRVMEICTHFSMI